MIARLRSAARLEDVLLAALLILVEPVLGTKEPLVLRGPSSLDGLLGLAGLAGLALCIGARSVPGVTTGLVAGGEVAATVGPLIGAFALVVDTTTWNLGMGDAGPVLAIGLVGLAIVARLGVPPLDAVRRRVLVTPFILVSAAAFGDFLTTFGDLFDARRLIDDLQGAGLAFAAFTVVLAILGVLIFYVMLVFAPRQVAEREGTAGTWALRFLLFVVSLAIGQTWLGQLRG